MATRSLAQSTVPPPPGSQPDAKPSPPAPPEELKPIEQVDLAALLNLPVVTASGGKSEARSLAAANVYTVTRDDIARHGWHSLAQILSNVPGLYVVDDLVYPSVGVRGVTGGLRAGTRIVKVMIDGVTVNFRPDLTAFLGPEFIPVESIERVEIAKGPLSALYGANAFLATINVITRRPQAGLEASVDGRGNFVGSNPGWGLSQWLGWGGEGVSFAAAASSDRFDRSGLSLQQTFPNQVPRFASLIGPPSQGDISSPASVFASLRGESTTWGTLTLEGGIQHLDANGEFQLNSVLTHASRLVVDNVWAGASYEKKWSNALSADLVLAYSQGSPTRETELYLTQQTEIAFIPNSSYRALNARAELGYAPGPAFDIRAGADFEWDIERVLYYTEVFNAAIGAFQPGDRTDVVPFPESLTQHLSDLGGYAQVTSQPFDSLPGLHLTGNLRVDKPNLFPVQLSWRAAAAYEWAEDVVTKIIVGSAFQSPSGALLFAQPGFGVSTTVLGNRVAPNVSPLVPQRVQSIEAVASAPLFGHFTADVGVYAQEIQQLITFVPTGLNFVATNQGTADFAGAEVTINARFWRVSPYLSGSLQHQVSPDLAGRLLPYPDLSGVLGLNLDVPEVRLRLNVQARGASSRGPTVSNFNLNGFAPYALPGYVLLDATLGSAGLHLLDDTHETVFRIAGRNLLGTRYFEPGFGGIDQPQLGATLVFEIGQEF